MATLSWTLLLALDQSVTPNIHPSSPPHSMGNPQEDSKPALVAPAKEHVSLKDHMNQPDAGLTHFSDGLDEDIYWNDGSA